MCGLCGELRLNGSPASAADVQAMMDTMESRGPDGSGLFHQGAVALGHRRLSIIDLSERGQQPMVDSDLGLAIVYNGALYNYPELRTRLEQRGYNFFSHSDTEVILKAFHAWGHECVKRFNGMFAFAVWQRDTGNLFIARDRLGIKPLYYAETSTSFRFASTLPALLRAGDVDTGIDGIAFHHYMSFHSVVPAPRTLLRGVKKLPPASTMTITPDGRREIDRYWSLQFGTREKDYTFDEWKRRLLDKLQSAVERRIVADVPVGVLLSGGLDSSLVVGLLAERMGAGIDTFSIGFESVAGTSGNEFEYSDIVAETFRTRHRRIQIDGSETLENLEPCVRAMSEPMMSHDCVGFYLLSREVAKDMKVVESGQGADEIFAGYHWYPPLMDSTDAVKDYRSVFFDREHEEFLEAAHADYHGPDHSMRFVGDAMEQQDGAVAVDKALHLDTTVMLIEDPVKRVDNMTMAWGLEARVPFLDHELVEFAASIPAQYKVSGGGKHILKEVAREIIPAEVIDRPKGYFPVPGLTHIRGRTLDFVRNVLDQDTARNRKLFNRKYLDTLLEAPDEHLTPLRGSKLWQAAVLEFWLQIHGI